MYAEPAETPMSNDTDRMYLCVPKGELKDLEIGQEVTVTFKARVKGLIEDTRREWDEKKEKPGKEEVIHEIRLEYAKKDVEVLAPNEFEKLAED